MNAQKRLGRLVTAASLAAVLGIGIMACDTSVARGPVGPSPAAGAAAANPGAPPVGEGSAIAAVRRATAKYQNINAALADGYVDDGFGCIDAVSFGLDPSVGGMGFHLINWALHDDPNTDPERPDLLVYNAGENPHGQLKLVALEYEVFTADWLAAGHTNPPTMLGHEMKRLVLPQFDFDAYELHLWIWHDNPAGLFEDFNPSVPMCH